MASLGKFIHWLISDHLVNDYDILRKNTRHSCDAARSECQKTIDELIKNVQYLTNEVESAVDMVEQAKYVTAEDYEVLNNKLSDLESRPLCRWNVGNTAWTYKMPWINGTAYQDKPTKPWHCKVREIQQTHKGTHITVDHVDERGYVVDGVEITCKEWDLYPTLQEAETNYKLAIKAYIELLEFDINQWKDKYTDPDE
jgi:carboxypeptidase C (cathepsin A)